MVGKIKTGANFKGVLRYNEKEQAELIDKNMAGNNAQDLTREFLLGQELNKRVEKPVKHHIISFGRVDKEKLTPELLQEITQDYLHRFGYSNNQYVSYLHQDTNLPHLHIIVNKVDMDGQNTHLKLEKNRARKILMELEKKYGLEETREHNPDKDAYYDKTYTETQKRLYRQDLKKTDKEYIHTAIASAIDQKPISPDDFAKKIKEYGVELIRQGGGYKFSYKGREYKASTIHREFSYSKLNQIFERNNEKRKQAAKQIHGEPEKKAKQRKRKGKQQRRKVQTIYIQKPKSQKSSNMKTYADHDEVIRQYNEKLLGPRDDIELYNNKEFLNAIANRNVKAVRDYANKQPSKSLSDLEIRYLVNHSKLSRGDKVQMLSFGGVENPNRFFFKDEKPNLKTPGRNQGKNKDKGPDISM